MENIIKNYVELGGDNGSVQILAPTINSKPGTSLVNTMCQQRYRANDPRMQYFSLEHEAVANTGFYLNDPVIFKRNDYSRELMNGTLGRINKVFKPGENQEYVCRVDFEGIHHKLTIDDLLDIDLAYAITTHKSQGSQFERVIYACYKTRLMDQSIIYTAVTRAIRQVVIIGDEAIARVATEKPPSAFNRKIGFDVMLTEALS